MPNPHAITAWIAIHKKTHKPVAVSEYMEDLPMRGNWLVEVEIDLSEKLKEKTCEEREE